jgi:uncharacterized membrane protein YozB (DUF420 family)
MKAYVRKKGYFHVVITNINLENSKVNYVLVYLVLAGKNGYTRTRSAVPVPVKSVPYPTCTRGYV